MEDRNAVIQRTRGHGSKPMSSHNVGVVGVVQERVAAPGSLSMSVLILSRESADEITSHSRIFRK